jgi:hypothetical protein
LLDETRRDRHHVPVAVDQPSAALARCGRNQCVHERQALCGLAADVEGRECDPFIDRDDLRQ